MSSPITNSNLINPSIDLSSKEGEKQQFLKFNLEPDTKVMLSLHSVTEVLKIPLRQIVPIPQMPPWTMGIYNWRGEILWTIDLGHLIGLYSWHEQPKQNTNYSVIIISSENKTKKKGNSAENLGLIITQIEDIEWYNPDLIQSPPASAVTVQLAPFLQGYFMNPEGQMILVLNSNAIISAMPKKIE